MRTLSLFKVYEKSHECQNDLIKEFLQAKRRKNIFSFCSAIWDIIWYNDLIMVWFLWNYYPCWQICPPRPQRFWGQDRNPRWRSPCGQWCRRGPCSSCSWKKKIFFHVVQYWVYIELLIPDIEWLPVGVDIAGASNFATVLFLQLVEDVVDKDGKVTLWGSGFYFTPFSFFYLKKFNLLHAKSKYTIYYIPS